MSGSLPTIGIVILNWNGWTDTIDCLEALKNIEYPNCKIYVVDNASSDDSIKELCNWDPNILLICNDRNLGWSGGNNVGIEAALESGAEHIWLLNNDAIPTPDSLLHLVNAATMAENVAAVGSLIISAKNPEWAEFAGYIRDPRTNHPRQIMDHRANIQPATGAEEVEAVKGCSMLLTNSAIKKIGLLSEEYFLNYEETDWCLRARKAGLINILSKDSVVSHKGAKSFKGTNTPMYRYFMCRNRLLFSKRNLGTRETRFAWQNIQWELRQCLFENKQNFRQRLFSFLSVLLGVHNHLTQRYGDCPKIIRWFDRNF